MRAFNFSAGPSILSNEVLEQAADELPNWQRSGMSVMEMSHRGPHFTSILEDALSDLTDLLDIPATHQLLFMQGGGIAANAIVPLNMLRDCISASFVVTGAWSKRSFEEASKYCCASLATQVEVGPGGSYVPSVNEWCVSAEAAYLHLCTNETIDGIEIFSMPDLGSTPIVADVSSHILSRPMDVSRFGVLYAGAQKNIGIAGLTVFIVRKDLLDRAITMCPSAFEWRTVAANNSMYNTPPTYAIYIAGLVFKWLKRQGGLTVMEERNIEKSTVLYRAIDSSSLYSNKVSPAYRSRMNVPFHLADANLDSAFLEGAKAHGLLNLKGHRLVGGMRASLYNALPLQAVHALVDYMREFEEKHA
jgi:phosphoserine aminotransferase